MKLTVRYNLLKEFSEAINILCHPSESKNLRSVIWPTPFALFSFAASSKTATVHIQDLWRKNSAQISAAFTKQNLKDPGDIICYIHGISCEGWFDIDDNSIHVRIPKVDDEKELLNTIIHEIIHLITYKENLSHDESENIVEKYIESPDINKILRSL